MNRLNFTDSKRVVIKLGSSIITKNGEGIDKVQLQSIIEQIAELAAMKKEIVLVSSGAIAAGLKKLGYKKRPKELSELRAAASVGQLILAQIYEQLFTKSGLVSSLILLTHDDLSIKKSYLNARSTICKLIEQSIIPVINENDTVADDEIRFGDNDTLAAMVANLIEADYLVLLTDQMGLFSDDPRKNKQSNLIEHAFIDNETLEEAAKDTESSEGTGGMITKIYAAQRASLSGTDTIIASGKETNILLDLNSNKLKGTHLETRDKDKVSKKIWMANHLKPKGKIFIDKGAEEAIVFKGKSLLSAGVIKSEGRFERGEIVRCINAENKEIAKGLINYSCDEIEKIKGLSSNEIEPSLGYINESNLIHRDNMVILLKKKKES
jgi:glutamate 5-kinase